MKLYVDSSALVKLVQREAESQVLRGYLRAHRGDERLASELVRVDLVRAVLRGGPVAVAHARRQLSRLYRMAVDRALLDRAATLAPASLLRSLDAIHLASAELLGAEVRAVDLRRSTGASRREPQPACGITQLNPSPSSPGRSSRATECGACDRSQ